MPRRTQQCSGLTHALPLPQSLCANTASTTPVNVSAAGGSQSPAHLEVLDHRPGAIHRHVAHDAVRILQHQQVAATVQRHDDVGVPPQIPSRCGHGRPRRTRRLQILALWCGAAAGTWRGALLNLHMHPTLVEVGVSRLPLCLVALVCLCVALAFLPASPD